MHSTEPATHAREAAHTWLCRICSLRWLASPMLKHDEASTMQCCVGWWTPKVAGLSSILQMTACWTDIIAWSFFLALLRSNPPDR